MEELDNLFQEYMNEFKKLNIIQKRSEVLNSIKELIAAIEKFAEVDRVSLEYLKSGEILDISKSDTEDDFLEAEIVYIENAKNLIGQYLDQTNQSR